MSGTALGAKSSRGAAPDDRRVLGRPPSTVRGWLRAFTARAELVRQAFTALAAGLVTDPPLAGPAAPPSGDAVAAVAAAAVSGVEPPAVLGGDAVSSTASNGCLYLIPPRPEASE